MTGERGYTVLEALLVLALLAILAAVAMPAVAATAGEVRLDRAAAEYAGALQEAQANAIAQSVPWRVTVPAAGPAGPGISGGPSAYALQWLDDQGQWQTERSATLQGVAVTATDPVGVTRVAFVPSGGPEPACVLTLTATGSHSVRRLSVQPATGRVEVAR